MANRKPQLANYSSLLSNSILLGFIRLQTDKCHRKARHTTNKQLIARSVAVACYFSLIKSAQYVETTTLSGLLTFSNLMLRPPKHQPLAQHKLISFRRVSETLLGIILPTMQPPTLFMGFLDLSAVNVARNGYPLEKMTLSLSLPVQDKPLRLLTWPHNQINPIHLAERISLELCSIYITQELLPSRRNE